MYIPKDWHGRIGVIGDMHISSRQSLYKQQQVKAQVIPGADPEKESPYIGKIAHQCLQSVDSLMEGIGTDCDVLVLAGDLYDHTRNCDPYHFAGKVNNTGQLWDAMDFSQHEKDYDAYPREIDGLMMLSRVLDFYTKRQKPVIYISGNHEGYERPFGVSPRVRLSDAIPLMHADSGIPADHNLTAYEACLLHGKASYDLGTGLPWKLNFNKENFEWLYCLFSPWQDFVFSYAAKSQEKTADGKPAPDAVYNFVALGWGDDETIVDSWSGGGGTLPRTQVACTEDQLALTKWATDKSGANYNILLSHFTFVGYDLDKPFSDKEAHVLINDKSATIKPGESNVQQDTVIAKTHYDIGSFYNNRPAMYGLLKDSIFYLQDGKSMPKPGKIHYTISGHAHRAGAYAFASTDDAKDFKTTACLYSDPGKPLAFDLRALSPGKSITSARCLVCGSAGPYSHRNRNGELGGQGLARPQGLILDVPNDRVEWREALADPPRLAVIMDYLWYIGKTPPFENGIYNGKDGFFYFQLNSKFRDLFPRKSPQEPPHPFASIKLIAAGKESSATLTMQPSDQEAKDTKDTKGNSASLGFAMRLDPDLPGFKKELKKLQQNGDEIQGYFLSITFKAVPGAPKGAEYDLKSPWCFPVKIDGDDYDHIYRWSANENGEVPNWKYYGDTWGKEYDPKQANR